MNCPQCVQQIYRSASVCPHCGFSIKDADEIFSSYEICLTGISDQAGLFRHKEIRKLERALEGICRKFPQISLVIHTRNLGDKSLLRPFGFWLFNRASFEDLAPNMSKEFGILILIDPDSKAASLTFGYALDAILNEANTFHCLAEAHALWLEERYLDGLLRCLRKLSKLLENHAKKTSVRQRESERILTQKSDELISP